MMKVLKATETQYNELNGYTNGLYSLIFIKDADENWITSERLLTDINFQEIWNSLSELEIINYKPKVIIPGQ